MSCRQASHNSFVIKINHIGSDIALLYDLAFSSGRRNTHTTTAVIRCIQALKHKMANLIQMSDEQTDDHTRTRLQELVSDPASAYVDKTTTVLEKLEKLSSSLSQWMANEPTRVLQTESPLTVSDHASFGKLKAILQTSCTCRAAGADVANAPTSQTHQGKPTGPSCMFHTPDPDMKDVMYNVARSVHHLFGDSWSCFANLFLEECSAGRG